MDYSPPGSSIHGIFQARVLEWVAVSFSRGSFWPRDQTQVSGIAGRCFTIWVTRNSPLETEGIVQVQEAGFVAPQVSMTTEPQTAEPLCKDCHFTCWSKADVKESLGRPTAYNSTVTEYVSSRCRVSPSSSIWINNEKHFLSNLCKLQNKAWEI